MKVNNLRTDRNRTSVAGPLESTEDVYLELVRLVEILDQRLTDIVTWLEQLTLPEYTTTERNALASVSNGQLIYNSTTSRVEIRQDGAWKYITTVSSV